MKVCRYFNSEIIVKADFKPYINDNSFFITDITLHHRMYPGIDILYNAQEVMNYKNTRLVLKLLNVVVNIYLRCLFKQNILSLFNTLLFFVTSVFDTYTNGKLRQNIQITTTFSVVCCCYPPN